MRLLSIAHPAGVGVLAGLLTGWAGGSLARAQPPESPAVVLPQQQVEVVRIEVVVAEKHGQPRMDLTRDDFVVLEDGKPQPIVQFHSFARTPTPAPPAPAAAPATQAAAEEAEDLLPARYVVLAIDDVHMEFDSLVRTRKALTRFLDEDLRPEDQVALVTTSGASALSQEFTSDRAVLQQTLSRLNAQGRHAEWSGVPHISDYQAELIEGGDPIALDAAVQEILQSGILQDADSAEQDARGKSRAVFAESVYNARLTLEALESLCRGLSGLTGRKALFLVSDGFLTGLTGGSGLGFDVRRIADAGTRAGVVIYALDTRGLVASAPAANAASPLHVGPATFGSIEAMRQRSVEATRDAMNALAADTGGFLVANANDLRAGLHRILKDTETYYVLAYEPTNTKRDGGFRRIEVRLPNRRDLRVRTRSGYFAPDERRAAATSATMQDQARRAEQRRAEMRTALGSLAPLTAIPVHLSTDFVSLDPDVTQVVVSGSVDVTALPFVHRSDRLQATVETVALVYDEAGAIAATLETERTTLDLSDADYAVLRRRGVPYRRTAPLKPGRYQVRLAVREDATGLLGSAWGKIEIPDLAAGRLTLSSLFLLKDDGTSGAPGGPHDAPTLRSVQDRPRFGRTENLYVQLYAYGPKRDAAGAFDLVSQAEVLRKGAVLATAAPEPMTPEGSGTPVPHLSRIRLQAFAPGDYELRVTVADRKAGAIVARRVAFTIE
jgi:VWFA-related protein